MSGDKWFNNVLPDRKKAAFIDPCDALPEDDILVIFNSYNAQFFSQVENILKHNVETMRKIINECNLDKVQGICIVSTDYVQSP